MKPLDALESVMAAGCYSGGTNPSDGIKYYLRNNKEIPERFLPGGMIKRAKPEVREALSRLTSCAMLDVPDWVVKRYVG